MGVISEGWGSTCPEVGKSLVFFRESPKRSNYLKTVVDEIHETSEDDRFSARKNIQLKKMCLTRWVESQESTVFCCHVRSHQNSL